MYINQAPANEQFVVVFGDRVGNVLLSLSHAEAMKVVTELIKNQPLDVLGHI